MALTDMKRTKQERKARDSEMKASLPGSEDSYPYGLSVHLDHESLGKLGVDKLPNVGDKLHLHAHAHVTEVREENREGGKKHRHVTLQLRKMALGAHEDDAHKSQVAAKGAKGAMDAALAEQEQADDTDGKGTD